MMAGAGGVMRATGRRATAIRFQQFGEGVAHELEKRLEQGRLEIAIYWAQRRSDPKPKSGVEDVHIIGRLMEQIDHAGAPRENRIIRFDELKTTDAARPLKWAESHVVGPSWRIAAKIGRASQ